MVRMRGMKHSYVMVALVVVGGALFFSGVGGGAVFLLWPLAFVGMMVAMMWGMRGMGKPAQHTHPDGVTHSHDEDLTRSGR
ncbi:MAG: hypothetical protein DLM59_08065 [Pseudonocardiales bacterium]|nr:MAG: hypothetical protein DLM59_08065 [Pseudonocardiales bacterium]